MLKDHLGQLLKAGYLKEFMADSGNRGARQGALLRGNPLPSLLGVIKVIHATPKSMASTGKGVLTVAPVEKYSDKQPFKKKMRLARGPFSFNDSDLKGTIQLHDDALMMMA